MCRGGIAHTLEYIRQRTVDMELPGWRKPGTPQRSIMNVVKEDVWQRRMSGIE